MKILTKTFKRNSTKNFVKRILILILSAILVCLLCACTKDAQTEGGDTQINGRSKEITDKSKQINDKDRDGTGKNTETDNNTAQQNNAENLSHKSGALHFLCGIDSNCSTENGYYYLTEETKKLRDENYATYLMYMDFATCQEIYLCSTAGCKHDTADCPAVFLYDDFPVSTTKLFVWKENLYILSKEYDDDGGMYENVMSVGDTQPESSPAVLYKAKLDGTERKQIYTFDSDLTLEDMVVGDENGIYIITKKVCTDKAGTFSYMTSSERKLMFLDLESFNIKEICSMDFNDKISWNVTDCCGNFLILKGIDFGREISKDEKWNDDIYKSLYENSFDVYSILDLESGTVTEIYRGSNKYSHSSHVIGDILYLSSSENQNIEGLNIITGEKKTVCTLSQNLIMDVLGDMLCCRDWNLAGDFTWYFVDTKTGEIYHSSLVNKCNGWDLEFYAETASDVLVVNDYDAKKGSDESYEIYQMKYALISKEDLFSGKENYRKIKMIGTGQ